MKIILAKSAGFCFGVSRAMKLVLDEIKKGKKIKTLGPLIHNDNVISYLEKNGVGVISDVKEATPDTLVVIRSHGVSKEIENYLKENNIEYIDATCPFVKRIHKIVEQSKREGRDIVIIGNKNHPEVIGINGWCENSAEIIENETEAQNYKNDNKVAVVAQTTFNREIWQKSTKILKNTCKDIVFFDTICSATDERQKEAAEIAKASDIFFVIGDKKSSNTQKLYDICKNICPTYHIENKNEIFDLSPYKDKVIGITSGASTPDWIIKEALNTMEDFNQQGSEMSFAEAFERSLKVLNTGDVVQGTVIGLTPTEVYVDLGFKMDGVIPLSELTDDPTLKPSDVLKVGDEIEAFVVRVSDMEGTVMLSKKRLDSIKGLEKIEEAYNNQSVLTGRIIEAVNGGVVVLSHGIKIFVPASQASDRFLQDLTSLIGKEVKFRVINIKEERRRKKFIGSIKSVAIEEKERLQKEFWDNVEVGKTYKGVVKTLTNFGAFVDLGGVDGLIHISELSWNKIKHPSEVLKEGQIVEVVVLEADKENQKVSLGYRKSEDNPWVIAQGKYNLGDVVSAKVVRLVPFGAFVELMPGVDGLIHISQISTKRIGKPEDVLTVGQVVEAKIVELDWEAKKIGLSIRALIEEEKAKENQSSEGVENKESAESAQSVSE
ncbi:MAG: bifunctional 4-hydroxy-3-methylbut-2-enyl diphosphate reductase/30S ribosomal protein S1 [Clostridiaceae bacterium]|nr:bifunctional 4-hydroxy-3-methylbut-2-enyl diphosphate reductase/30S ribosomal protein S1 [Clostridiaceae bacterium]